MSCRKVLLTLLLCLFHFPRMQKKKHYEGQEDITHVHFMLPPFNIHRRANIHSTYIMCITIDCFI